MDVSMSSPEVKAYGAPVAPTAIEVEDRAKPQVQPVQQGSDAARSALDEKTLRGKTGKEQKFPSQEKTKEYVMEIQKRLDSIGANLQLSLATDQKTDSLVARITEKNTGELVRQIPPESVLALKSKLEELTGLIFDEKA